MAKVEFKNIKKSFGDVEVVKEFDFTVEDGEFVVFLGPSGCGKSTTLRMLAGLESISSGDIVVGGNDRNAVSGLGTGGTFIGAAGCVLSGSTESRSQRAESLDSLSHRRRSISAGSTDVAPLDRCWRLRRFDGHWSVARRTSHDDAIERSAGWAAVTGRSGGQIGVDSVQWLAAPSDGRADSVECRVLRFAVGASGSVSVVASQPDSGSFGDPQWHCRLRGHFVSHFWSTDNSRTDRHQKCSGICVVNSSGNHRGGNRTRPSLYRVGSHHWPCVFENPATAASSFPAARLSLDGKRDRFTLAAP